MKLRFAFWMIVFWGLQCPLVAVWITWWPASWEHWGVFYLTELSILTAVIGAVIFYDNVKNTLSLKDLDERTDVQVD